ncbi:MAG: hypothetical protein QOJ95_5700, partial [Mycobacterium sp.]|nr:hypothetical protein [Mycobacterium sp.]
RTRLLHRGRRRRPGADPSASPLRDLRGRRRLRPAAHRHGARRSRRPDRRLHARRGGAGRACTGRSARTHLVRPQVARLPGTGDVDGQRGRHEGSRRHRRDGDPDHAGPTRRADDRRGPQHDDRGHVDGHAVADGRPAPLLADARRLPTRQHAVRPRPRAHDRRRLADAGGGVTRTRPGVLRRNQPGSQCAIRGRRGPRRGLPLGVVELRRHGLRP